MCHFTVVGAFWAPFCLFFLNRLFLLAAVVEGTIFCAHAGLSPQLYDLDLVSFMKTNCKGNVNLHQAGIE